MRKALFAVVGLILVIPTLWVLVSITARPLFPTPESVPASMESALPQWADAVARARQIVRASVAEQNLPGLSVAVGIDGTVVWAEGFGFADLKRSEPVTPEHRFRIGTASEVFTAAAADLLLKDGRLKLDEEIQTYVPSFPKKAQPITLRQLMEHSPGVTPDDNDEAPLFTQHCERPVEALQHYKNWLFNEDRDSIYDYIVVSAAIEAASGQPFLTFMHEKIFDPLGMRATVADPAVIEGGEDFPLVNMVRELIHDPEATQGSAANASKGTGTATPYSTRFRSDPNYGMHLARPADSSCYLGASGFLSTPSDLVLFGMATNLPTERIDGDSASLMKFKERGMVVAVMSNVAHADTSAIGLKIAEAFRTN